MELTCEQRLKAGRCLTCGGLGHFATQCPSPVQASTAPLQVKKPGPQQAQKSVPVKKSAKSTLDDLLGAAKLEDLDPEEMGATADLQPAGNE